MKETRKRGFAFASTTSFNISVENYSYRYIRGFASAVEGNRSVSFMCVIYVLELIDNKYYVAKSEYASLRIDVYFGDDDSKKPIWTRKYKPISIVEIITDGDDNDEDRYVLKYMKKYGIENVRGGTFSQVVLPASSLMLIDKMMSELTDQCNKCNKVGHLTSQCDNQYDSQTEPEKIEQPFKSVCIPSTLTNIFSYVQSVVLPDQCDHCNSEDHPTDKCPKKIELKIEK